MRERDIRYDIMKGVGILLMMVGHIPVDGIAYKIIYSFHMPMFFLLSGYLTREGVTFGGIFFSTAKRFFLPFIVTIGCIIMIQVGVRLALGESITISHVMGPLWFLPAMWWAKTTMIGVYSAKRLEKYWLIIAMLIGIAALLISRYWMEDEVFVLQGLCAVPFIAIGHWLKMNRVPRWLMWISIILWICAISFSKMNMRTCIFGCYPIDVIGACGGTYVLFNIVDWLQKFNRTWLKIIQMPLVWIGRFSLAVLCAHGLEWKALLPLESMTCEGMALLVMRFIVTIVLAIVFVYVPIIKKIYR